jgi:hypothetical protein
MESKDLQKQSLNQSYLIGDWIKNDEELSVAKTIEGKLLGNYNRSDMANLVDIIARWRVLLGVQVEMSAEELIFLCQFIYDNFKYCTLNDIELTMSWVVSGKINPEYVSQKTISAFYVSKCINLYFQRKREIVNEILQNKHKMDEKKEIKKIDLSATEKAESFKNHIIIVYRNYKEDGWLLDFGDFIYDWMKRANLVRLTQLEIDNALQYANQRFNSDKNDINKIRLNIKFGLNNDKSIEQIKKKFAREYVIVQFFKNREIKEIISLIKLEQF